MSDENKTTDVVRADINVAIGKSGITIATLSDLCTFAGYISKSKLAPKGLERREDIIVCIQMGLELGLPPMMALQNIAVINGRPSLWGDAIPGLIYQSGMCEYIHVEPNGLNGDDHGFTCHAKRKGGVKEVTWTFTIADAKTAGVWGKSGPWSNYPDVMLKNRAQSFCLRQAFPDILKGMKSQEEVRDMVDAEVLEVMTAEKKSVAEKVQEKANKTRKRKATKNAVVVEPEPEKEVTPETDTEDWPAPDPEPETNDEEPDVGWEKPTMKNAPIAEDDDLFK